MRPSAFAITFAILLSASNLWAQEVLKIEHNGDTDPVSEGWTAGSSAGFVMGPINDGGTPAWFVDDNSTTGGGGGLAYYLTPQEELDAAAGWRFVVTMRAVDSPNPEGSPMAYFRSTTRSYSIYFANTQVRLITSPPFSGISYPVGPGYHTYELAFDGTSQTTTFKIDGTTMNVGYAGHAWSNPAHMAWIAGSTADTGQGNFSHVAFYLGSNPPVAVESRSWSDVKADFE